MSNIVLKGDIIGVDEGDVVDLRSVGLCVRLLDGWDFLLRLVSCV